MPINSSSKEKTVKSMYSALSSDNWTIDKVTLYAKYNNKCIVPAGNILDNYNDYFSQFLEDANVDKKFYYQPAAFSENYYGTPDLDFIVLYFARMFSLFEFNKPVIKVLPKTKLVELNKLLVQYKNKVENSKANPTEYIKQSEVEVISKNYK